MPGRRIAVFALFAVLAATAVAGCGGDDDNGAESWANSVCTDLSTWVTALQDALESVTSQGLQADRADIQAAVDEVKEANSDLADSLRELGPPETDTGDEAKSQLDELATNLEQQVDEAEQALDSDSPVAALQAVGTALSAAASDVQSTFDNLQELDPGGELEDAFENADACDSLQEQAGG